MTQQEIGAYYSKLSAGRKGMFTAFLSVHLGGSPHSWQHKLLSWSKGKLMERPLSPVIQKELSNIITQEQWQ